MTDDLFIRYESAYRDSNGHHIGVFGMINVLGRHGMLSPEEESLRQKANAWYDLAYPDPMRTDETVYDNDVNPGAAGWFKASAIELLARIPPYLAILDAHHIAWRERTSGSPGQIIYEDQYQVIVAPCQNRPEPPNE